MEENKTIKSCTFFGTHPLPYLCERFHMETLIAILTLFEGGCHTFYFCGQGDFDAFCHRIVSIIKAGHAYHIETRRILCVKDEAQVQKQKNAFVPERYEDVICLPTDLDQEQKSTHLRNCAMIDASDAVIFCVEEKGNSNAYRAYKYAQEKGKKTVNLWEKYAPILVPRDEYFGHSGVFYVD